MCGINGLYTSEEFDRRNVLEKMNRMLAHRGPDADAIYEDEDILLGHTRLKIIDLSDAANQHFGLRFFWE